MFISIISLGLYLQDYLYLYLKYKLLYKIDKQTMLASVFSIKFNKCAVVSKTNVDA